MNSVTVRLTLKIPALLLMLLAGPITKAQQYSNITFQHSGKTVYGGFTKPNGPGPFKTIVIVPGSGKVDRDGTIILSGANAACLYPALLNATLRPYRQLGDALVKAGYAVLRYNKLEYNYTTQAEMGEITFEKLWLPFESAIKYLKTRTDVDTSNLILIGHSEGSALIPYVARNTSGIKALISLAGARTPFDSILAYQIVDFTQKCGGNMSQAQQQAGQILAYFHMVRNQLWDTSTPDLFGVSPQVWYDYVQANDPVAENYNAAQLPALFIGMALDINVPPSELIRFQNEVTVTGDFWSLPGLNHYMTPNHDPDIAPEVADTIIYWLSKKFSPTGLRSHPNNLNAVVYPNPAADYLSVSLNQQTENVELAIISITGQEVLNKRLSGNLKNNDQKMDVSDLFPGIYFLKIKSGEQVYYQKIIKE
jgi:dienelactone hydrolase